MKRFIKVASIALAVLVILMFFVGNYFYGESVKRGTDVVLHSNKTEQVNKVSKEDEQVFLEAKEWFNKQKPAELQISSYDELTLFGQVIEQEKPTNKAVILMHGFRKQGSDMGNYTKYYYDNNYNILLPDARGHGESEGDYYGYGWHDRLDLLKWIDVLIDDYDAEEIVLHGNSAGAATVLLTSGEPSLQGEVKAIVADSSYTSMKDELTHQLKHLYGLPASPLLEITSLISRVRAGYFFGEVDVVKHVAKTERPVFIIHGDADDLVPTHMSEPIFDAIKSEKELWIVPEASHIEAYDIATAEFEDRLTAFLDEYMSK